MTREEMTFEKAEGPKVLLQDNREQTNMHTLAIKHNHDVYTKSKKSQDLIHAS
jgi:hypothetical protein